MRVLFFLLFLLFPLLLNASDLPWENWKNLKNLARLNSETQSLLRSSYCPYNCRFDRTSSGDTRFFRVENGEAVIFEELNPGAITRIWMTTGAGGVSQDLDPNIHIKFYFDDSDVAQIEMPLPDLFNGLVLPFIYPLAANRAISSGGNFSYVPIGYSKNCKITLTNALDSKLWFQFNYQRMPLGTDINTFSLVSDYSELGSLLNSAGADVWSSYDSKVINNLLLQPGIEQNIYQQNTAGWVKSILLTIDESFYEDIKLLLYFDGELKSQLALSDFFALDLNKGVTTESLFVGKNNSDQIYSYFPMPFYQNASISLLLDESIINSVAVSYEVGVDIDQPNEDMGIFSTQLNNTCPSTPYIDTPLLNVSERGKWVGSFIELSSINTLSRDYLEGDERVFIDGDIHPTLFGTGTEDIFNGGFYFDQGSFSLPLNGSPYFLTPNPQKSITSAYRFMLTDPIEFQSSLYAGMENGAFGDRDLCAKVVSYYYSKPDSNFEIIDSLDLSSNASRKNHAYQSPENSYCDSLTATYLDEPPTVDSAKVCYRDKLVSSFTLLNPTHWNQLRLKRLIDNHYPNQGADVYVNNVYSGSFSNIPEKPEAYVVATPDRRWQQESLDLGKAFGDELNIVIVPKYSDLPSAIFNEAKYELLAKPRQSIFVDTLEDDPNKNICSEVANDCSLRGAINVVQDNGSIEFIVSGDIVQAQGVYFIDKNINLIGNDNIVLKTSTEGRHFYVSGAELSLTNLSLFGDLDLPIDNGGIIVASGELTLNKVTLSNNKGDFGSHIYSANSNITINHSYLQNGVTTNKASAIFTYLGDLKIYNSIIQGNSTLSNGDVIHIDGKFEMSHSSIVNNQSLEGNIFLLNKEAKIENSTLSNNHSPMGSLLKLNSIDSSLTLKSSTLTKNIALYPGLNLQQGTLELTHSVIAENESSENHSDCEYSSGMFTSKGYNFFGATETCTPYLIITDQNGSIKSPLEPKLGELSLQNGLYVHSIQAESPLIDAGVIYQLDIESLCTSVDQVQQVRYAEGSQEGQFMINYMMKF
jgi:hypothetical protein